jgi:hypothetical protein
MLESALAIRPGQHAEEREIHRISRRRKPVLFTVRLELDWDLVGFLKSQEYDEETPARKESLHTFVRRVITLSGDENIVQALPCSEYMEQIWPTTSHDFTQLLEQMVADPSQSHECKSFLLVLHFQT